MYIIPAIDILDKKVVRLREGDYKQVTQYDVSLEEMIEKYQSQGSDSNSGSLFAGSKSISPSGGDGAERHINRQAGIQRADAGRGAFASACLVIARR